MFNINWEAEQAVLGALLLEGDLVKDCSLKAKQFGGDRHQIIYQAMKDVSANGEAVDVVTVTSRLRQAKALEDVGGAEYLFKLSDAVPITSNFDHYERKVLESWKERAAAQAITKKLEGGVTSEDIGELIATLRQIDEYGDDDDDYDHDYEIGELLEAMAFPQVRGIPTGYSDLDKLVSVEPGQLVVIAARPSIGKTDFCLNVARMSARKGEGNVVPVVVSLEMKRRSLLYRMMAAESHIPSTKVRNGNLEEQDWTKVSPAAGILSGLPFKIYDKKVSTVADIRSKVRKVIKNNPGKQVILYLDYLQLLRGSRQFGNKTEEVTEISRDLKLLALDLDIPVVALSQLNRGVESRQDKRPIMSDLRDSGAIEQDADTIGFLYRDDYYNPESEKRNLLEVLIVKQREGATGMVELVYNRQWNSIVNIERPPTSG